jgi:hypothetical protein
VEVTDPNATVTIRLGEEDGDQLDWIWCFLAGVLTGVALAWTCVLAAMWISLFHPGWLK